MERTKGELHNHGLTIHLQQNDGDKETEHTCIANMNEVHTAYDSTYAEQEANAHHLVKCWNAFEEGGIVDELVKACEAMLSSFREVETMTWACDLCKQAEQALAKAKEVIK